ncbi:hypothetical protein L1987_35210 [Smallanthus sonchifolius]|uniref:Uncharacterized protein n=2 Tax=Smallanthus sonchifolius TaxID=185202 RepID=A0ACB9HVZ2_9ASTR|nr:hypothetical protein L1987_35207 [Smallanthus sonchifolius]KAI3799905.1 hypothetical protein L1987_35210 [Smallanthus sonchifolius]
MISLMGHKGVKASVGYSTKSLVEFDGYYYVKSGKVKRGGVVVAFSDARALPWRVNRWYKEEPILVVVDRGQREVVADDGYYLVLSEDELKVERGAILKEKAHKESLERGAILKEKGRKESLGSVVIVVRPPREDNENELAEEDWE